MKENKLYLQHIAEAIKDIEEYLDGLSYNEFTDNKLIIDGVTRKLEIIGEATKLLSNDFIRSHMEIPWRDMADMRNKLIHEYFGVQLEVVWDTVKNDLPELKAAIKPLLN